MKTKRPSKRYSCLDAIPDPYPDPYLEFFEWCDGNGFKDVGSGPAKDMAPQRFNAAIAAYALHHLPAPLRQRPGDTTMKPITNDAREPGSLHRIGVVCNLKRNRAVR